MREIAIGTFIGSIAFFMIYVVLLVYYKSFYLKGRDLGFKNTFGYEIYSALPIRSRILLYCSLMLNVALGIFSYFFALRSFMTTYTLIVGIVYVISYIAIAIANITPLTFYKTHLLASIFAVLGYAFASILIGFSFLVEGAFIVAEGINPTIFIIIAVLGIITLLACFNKKLLSWAKMDKAEENGKTFYVKPKVNWLALYEWIVYLLINITNLLLIIYLFIA